MQLGLLELPVFFNLYIFLPSPEQNLATLFFLYLYMLQGILRKCNQGFHEIPRQVRDYF